MRFFVILSLILVTLGCTNRGARPYSSPPEMRTAAAVLTGKQIVSDSDQSQRINLKPSPGRIPMIGQPSREVLHSSPTSNYYVAFTGQVPITQYFDVVRQADCDDWVYLQLMNPSMIRTNPGYYLSGNYSEDKAAIKCADGFHIKYLNGKDERLIGTDGVVFDAGSAVFTKVDGWAIGFKKLHMDGWAIKFREPSDEAIHNRLSQRATKPIDVVQMKTVTYWIEQHSAHQYADELRKLLPLSNKRDALIAWQETDRDVFHALAAVDNGPIDTYFQIVEAGIAETLRPGFLTTVSSSVVGIIPYIAANVLACKKRPDTIPRLRKVALEATIYQHKMASVKALIALGDTSFIQEKLKTGMLGDVSTSVQEILDGRYTEPFICPYRSK